MQIRKLYRISDSLATARNIAREDISLALESTLVELIVDCWRLMIGNTEQVENELNTPFHQSYYHEFFTRLGFPDLAILAQSKPSLAIYQFMVLMDEPAATKYGHLKTAYDSAYAEHHRCFGLSAT